MRLSSVLAAACVLVLTAGACVDDPTWRKFEDVDRCYAALKTPTLYPDRREIVATFACVNKNGDVVDVSAELYAGDHFGEPAACAGGRCRAVQPLSDFHETITRSWTAELVFNTRAPSIWVDLGAIEYQSLASPAWFAGNTALRDKTPGRRQAPPALQGKRSWFTMPAHPVAAAAPVHINVFVDAEYPLYQWTFAVEFNSSLLTSPVVEASDDFDLPQVGVARAIPGEPGRAIMTLISFEPYGDPEEQAASAYDRTGPHFVFQVTFYLQPGVAPGDYADVVNVRAHALTNLGLHSFVTDEDALAFDYRDAPVDTAGGIMVRAPPAPVVASSSASSDDNGIVDLLLEGTVRVPAGPVLDCAWAARKASRAVAKGADGRWAFEGCPQTFGTCPTDACLGPDDADWIHESGDPQKSCEWVSKFSGNRCSKKGVDGSYAFESCPRACRTCDSGCAADDEWWFHGNGDAEKGCDWVAAASGVRCAVRGADGRFAFEACPSACRCSEPCVDDAAWSKNASPEKTCSWIAAAEGLTRAKRCVAKGADAGLAYLSCPRTCGTCNSS
mmetsp:Transcript_27408/g.82257  ORF Transcript_27408/g.82257 Transcript_27408/m.82257 type:complete len:558 (+) Transcript_27408:89-1762(+)